MKQPKPNENLDEFRTQLNTGKSCIHKLINQFTMNLVDQN